MAFKSYIKIPRELFASEEWTSKRRFSRVEAQIDLLQSAAYADGFVVYGTSRDVTLKRGQLLTSQRDLATRWGWSATTVNRYLQTLRNSRRNSIRIKIETVIETGRTLITICNYDEWDFEAATDETHYETHYETPTETHIELNISNIENKDKSDTQLFTNKGGLGENFAAAELVEWIAVNVPTIAAMREPITATHAAWMVKRYPLDDIRRLIATMHSKGAHLRNFNAYSAFVGYAKSDYVMKGEQVGKLLTYEEYCDAVAPGGKHSCDDFERVVVGNKSKWKLKNT